ncbi:SIS domain-containing protein [Nonomuraea jiangxiensis]|uniref:Glutamine--fructose-6-phosphate aminotransferase [isomerizing] n=1 Tax=Nonomuraea jiangxiensis TaxID=633440 RepID=A0A1G8EMF2_9ACTN|nr:SIS domain-containing protein [Nonomuraea jiangxiensis]SDH71083.1 glucosamine--fructose-6-phosphate aminotransferase (isomerizing) [Nonomuraea jiangxiensis]
MNPEVLIRQAARLADDLREFTGVFARRAGDLLSEPERTSIGNVYLVGDGDSYHAGCATEPAFASIGEVPCRAAGAFRFAAYDSRWALRPGARRALVVAVTASGSTPAVLTALERAREAGALTVAVTGTPGSPVTGAAERVLAVDLPDPEPSPGVRTYQASLLGLLLIALRLGGAEALHAELASLADPVAATHEAAGPRARAEAEHVAAFPGTIVLGSGPNHGTAMFAAAKLAESAGLLALGQDLEEWAHVERWAQPADLPVYVLAPPGHAHGHAGAIAARARELGRRVVVVAEHGDAAATRAAHATFEVAGRAREEFSPFLYHLFAVHLAARVAQRLGRHPFQSILQENP